MKENRDSRKEKFEDPVVDIGHSSKTIDSDEKYALPKSILKVSFRQILTKGLLFYSNFFRNTKQSLLFMLHTEEAGLDLA